MTSHISSSLPILAMVNSIWNEEKNCFWPNSIWLYEQRRLQDRTGKTDPKVVPFICYYGSPLTLSMNSVSFCRLTFCDPQTWRMNKVQNTTCTDPIFVEKFFRGPLCVRLRGSCQSGIRMCALKVASYWFTAARLIVNPQNSPGDPHSVSPHSC